MKDRIRSFTSTLTFRVISSIVMLLILHNLISSVIGYTQFTESLTEEYNYSALRTAFTASALVDGDKMDEYLASGGESDEYKDTWRQLDVLCQTQVVTLIYLIDVDTSDYGRFTNVFNAVHADSGYSVWECGYQRDTTNEEYAEAYRALYEKELPYDYIVRTSELRGKEPHITTLLPVTKDNGDVAGIMCVQRPMSELNNIRREYLEGITVTTIMLSILALVMGSVFIKVQFISPIEKIKNEASRFARSNDTSGFSLKNISTILEISELGASLEQMEEEMIQYMDNLTIATAEQERLNTELTLAARIQASVLPNVFPPFPDRHEFDIYASMTPAKEVGGDFYDFFLLDDDHLGLAIADVSGKGVPAALFMMMCKSLGNSFAVKTGDPKETIEKLNEAICNNNEDDMFVTLWFGILTLSTGVLRAVNAGHEYPAIRRKNGQFELFKDSHGFVVGGMKGLKYKAYEIQLEEGDAIFLYTDGVPEASNAENEMFTTDLMLDALNINPDAEPDELLSSVKNAVDEFVGDAPQFDDLTMLALKLN